MRYKKLSNKKLRRNTKRYSPRGAVRKQSLVNRAYRAGAEAYSRFHPTGSKAEGLELQLKRHLQQAWDVWNRSARLAQLSGLYSAACQSFIKGYCNKADFDIKSKLLLPTSRRVACIITVMNEEAMLQDQLDKLDRFLFHEVIVVVNGSSDRSYEIAMQHPIQAKVAHFEAALGYDVGRAVGANLSTSDIVLFMDGDMSIDVKMLLPFIYEAEKGADVVLNPISKILPLFKNRDAVSHMKEFLNVCLNRPDLLADSLTAVPHVLSRRALRQLGTDVLSVPPLAHAKAVRNGLKVVSAPQTIDVIKLNKIRHLNNSKGNLVEQLIIGDHLEALYQIMQESGSRLQFTDLLRRRYMI